MVSLPLQNSNSYFGTFRSDVDSDGVLAVLGPPSHSRQWIVDICGCLNGRTRLEYISLNSDDGKLTWSSASSCRYNYKLGMEQLLTTSELKVHTSELLTLNRLMLELGAT